MSGSSCVLGHTSSFLACCVREDHVESTRKHAEAAQAAAAARHSHRVQHTSTRPAGLLRGSHDPGVTSGDDFWSGASWDRMSGQQVEAAGALQRAVVCRWTVDPPS